ncbi:CLUMA_CG002463, isoform A [Clunio marinus]|uniref:CLUMA_CG002463, isoform A n=1 Tax=Clunio marinus TaxID=568069 RepID=A0A1J1HKL4_9DIPT|nr:CLUMA_CG002463, isoform A [Clunio marinus]
MKIDSINVLFQSNKWTLVKFYDSLTQSKNQMNQQELNEEWDFSSQGYMKGKLKYLCPFSILH